MSLYRKYLESGSDEYMSFPEYKAKVHARRMRRLEDALPVIALAAMILYCLLMVGCTSVAPPAIGSDTRAGLETLSVGLESVGSDATAIESGATSIASSLAEIEGRAPEELKMDVLAVRTKSDALATLAGKHAVEVQVAKKEVASVKKSFGESMEKVAKLAEEKARVELKAEKSAKWAIIGWAGFAILAVLVFLAIFLKVKNILKF